MVAHVMMDWWMIRFVRRREIKGSISLDVIFKINIINSYGTL